MSEPTPSPEDTPRASAPTPVQPDAVTLDVLALIAGMASLRPGCHVTVLLMAADDDHPTEDTVVDLGPFGPWRHPHALDVMTRAAGFPNARVHAYAMTLDAPCLRCGSLVARNNGPVCSACADHLG